MVMFSYIVISVLSNNTCVPIANVYCPLLSPAVSQGSHLSMKFNLMFEKKSIQMGNYKTDTHIKGMYMMTF